MPSSRPASLRHLAARWRADLLASPTTAEGDAFARFVTPGVVRVIQLAGGANVLLVLAWWALDPVLFADDAALRGRYLVLRVGAIALQAAIVAGVTLVPSLRRRPVPWTAPLLFANAALIGWFVGGLGGPRTPWFHFTYLAVFFGVPAPLRVVPRLALTAAGAASVIAGYVAADPAHARDPFFAVAASYFAWTVLTATALGQATFRHSVESFRAARALEGFNATLEEKVATQTAALQALAARLDRAREDDRAYVARELHDELGQELAALRYAVSLARKRWERDPASLGPSLDSLTALVTRTAETTRGLVRELRPRTLLEMGLGPAIEWLVARADAPDGVEARFALEGELPEVDPEVAATVFRVAQEALTNALRHAEPARVAVRLAGSPDGLALTVTDDGRGFDPTATRERGGLGLVGMRERVRAMGGTFVVESVPGEGTTVRAALPATLDEGRGR